MNPRVAHIIPTDQIAYRMKTRLLRLQEAGFDLSIICGDRGYSEPLKACGLHVIHIPFEREISPWTDLRCMIALHQTLRQGNYDIVHSCNPKGTLLGPVISKLAQMPLVVHSVYGFLFNENTSGLFHLAAQAAERWCAFWTDHLLFQSQEDYTYAQHQGFKHPSQLHLVGNGINEHRFNRDLYPNARQEKRNELGLTQEDLVVGMVGRLVLEKGWEEFFQMAGRIAQKFDRARFLIIGVQEKKEQSDAIDPQKLMAENQVANRCIFLEQREDMPELYLSMDIAVLPSYREGIPRALLEAGAMGVPMVASNIRGCREVLDGGETGRLFGLKNVEEFTTVVASLLEDKALRHRLGETGRKHILEYYTETLATERLVACYHQFLGRGHV